MYVCILFLIMVSRELEARLEKQKATRRYIEEFVRKREEVSVYRSLLPPSLYIHRPRKRHNTRKSKKKETSRVRKK